MMDGGAGRSLPCRRLGRGSCGPPGVTLLPTAGLAAPLHLLQVWQQQVLGQQVEALQQQGGQPVLLVLVAPAVDVRAVRACGRGPRGGQQGRVGLHRDVPMCSMTWWTQWCVRKGKKETQVESAC